MEPVLKKKRVDSDTKEKGKTFKTKSNNRKDSLLISKDYILSYISGDEYCDDKKALALTDALYAPLLEKRNASRALNILTEAYPFPKDLKQLKRIRVGNDKSTLEVLLFMDQLENHSSIIKQLTATSFTSIPSDNLRDLSSLHDLVGLIGPLCYTQVPTITPLTRTQFEVCKRYWSYSFHENKELESKLQGRIFHSQEELKNFNISMKEAHLASQHSKAVTCCAQGAVIFHPEQKVILAKAFDLTNHPEVGHPLHHAPMVAIDMLAYSQGGGCYSYKPVLSEHPSLSDGLYFKPPEKTIDNKSSATDYIGTGLHVYLTHEPCIMCSMALLHSRVKCVFYEAENSEGGMGTLYKIHALRDLNHRFDVYKCKRLMES